jgi:hypothetical protein
MIGMRFSRRKNLPSTNACERTDPRPGRCPKSMKRGGAAMKKLILVAGVLVAATSAAMAQGYVYYGNPYGYGLGVYDYSAGSYPGIYVYVREPYAAPPGFDWDGAYGTASNWLYYRTSGPGRGHNEESTR